MPPIEVGEVREMVTAEKRITEFFFKLLNVCDIEKNGESNMKNTHHPEWKNIKFHCICFISFLKKENVTKIFGAPFAPLLSEFFSLPLCSGVICMVVETLQPRKLGQNWRDSWRPPSPFSRVGNQALKGGLGIRSQWWPWVLSWAPSSLSVHPRLWCGVKHGLVCPFYRSLGCPSTFLALCLNSKISSHPLLHMEIPAKS